MKGSVLKMCAFIIGTLISLAISMKIRGTQNETIDAKISMEKVLVKKLLKRYSQYGSVGRPVSNTSHSVDVKFALNLIQIINLKEKDQILTTSVWYNYKWTDILLQWDPAEYDNITTVRVPSSKIWIPDIVLYNFADTRLRETRDALVVVTYNGSTLWMPQAILKSTCQIDISFFPFDSQNCYLKFGSWTYDGHKLDLDFQDNASFLMGDYLTSHEWKVIYYGAERNVEYYTCCAEPFIDLKYHLHIQRRIAFYSVILVLPCTLLSLLTLVIFWVPPESPAKLQLGMNIFVAFFVLLLLLAESTPRASVSIPLIGAYYCLNMVMITVSTVLACFGTNMFFRGVRRNRAPKWLRTTYAHFRKFIYILLMVGGVARMLFSKNTFGNALDEMNRESAANRHRVNTSNNATKKIAKSPNDRHILRKDRDTDCLYVPTPRKSSRDNGWDSSQFIVLDKGDNPILREVASIRRLLENIQHKRVVAEDLDQYLLEWRIIAVATDRLFFIVYILVNVLVIVLILYA